MVWLPTEDGLDGYNTSYQEEFMFLDESAWTTGGGSQIQNRQSKIILRNDRELSSHPIV
jgi:hypothetical protein